uniref:Acetyltransferase n=1 Tax=Oryza brachyantha TaxID=4533 RepID=J3MAH6_ORYBR
MKKMGVEDSKIRLAIIPVYRMYPIAVLDAVNYDGHHLPLFVVQLTDLTDGVFVGFAYNHALSDGTAFWDFINAWAEIVRAAPAGPLTSRPPLLKRWSPQGDGAPGVLPYADLSEVIERLTPPPLRERMLHFSSESLVALKERARQELLAAGDTAGAAALTRFQALSSLMWRCITRARRLPPEQETAWMAKPMIYTLRFFDSSSVMMGSSPRFDMYGCDLGWGKAVAARSGRANKCDGKTSLYPGREGGGSMDAEVVLSPENMAALEQDHEFWAAVTPDS